MFLDDEELVELTKKLRRNAQRRVLNALGIEHKVRPDGSLAVLRSHVEKQFGGSPDAGRAKKPVLPDWSGVNA